MDYTLLPDLTAYKKHAIIQVHVSRKWSFHGATENGPLQHIDMVLSDCKGNSIYAEIPANLAEEKGVLIETNQIYDISRFRVTAAKTAYKPIDGDKMIQFTTYTIIKPASNPPPTFPLYIYRLTPFDEIESQIQHKTKFLDVLGTITEVTALKTVHIQGQLSPTIIRDVMIEDLSRKTLKITLWAKRATSFTIQDVYDPVSKKPILALFVGCLPKFYKGVYLSGGAACHWYFNPTIPEAEAYQNRRGGETIQLHLPTQPKHALQTFQPPTIEHKTLEQLLTMNPYDYPDTGYECTVTITKIDTSNTWWYPSCTKCGRKTTPHNTTYYCDWCKWDGYKFKYKLKFRASDATAMAQMFCFDNIARYIVGKSCEVILRSTNAATPIPPDLAQIVSLKFTFRVIPDDSSFNNQDQVPIALRIISITTAHGRQHALPLKPTNIIEGTSTPQNKLQLQLIENSPSNPFQNLSTSTPPTIQAARKLIYPPLSNPVTYQHTPKSDDEEEITEVLTDYCTT
ncbi:replication protein A 70 kDa DNA-binding subunit [Zea mays]|uniref:replication protein A 70 kDa DNA-binding subunit n=1 Tax=Zea mays TaxID=4577 RepID=UPI0009A9AB4E|nr:replication protein A 70 kDa DNA-binding subunit [Zea mays]|eukprot:XP_008646589.2 replication protein A 70 kDa DNA-binding subunit [Zea mays]